ncbi:hypothetical protein T440DRAFT_144533 [Plenodomus tracheiphilus IPT5]|uniref:Uncharacterized protein n=1 Tax=Plenodomus tracheiphilus IPT5 TaxID=1408161 RepID=A0A6A7B0G2_9PLEO|nr:hypothetical protein T440DRAFT_144533 [Plenodomus tracheiphilus IPT5]
MRLVVGCALLCVKGPRTAKFCLLQSILCTLKVACAVGLLVVAAPLWLAVTRRQRNLRTAPAM